MKELEYVNPKNLHNSPNQQIVLMDEADEECADEEENMHFMEAVQYLYNNKVIPDAIATSLMEKIMSRFSNTQEKNGKECNDD